MLPTDVNLDGVGTNAWLLIVGGRGEVEIPDNPERRRAYLDAAERLEQRGLRVTHHERQGRQFVRGHPSTVHWFLDLAPGANHQKVKESLVAALAPLLRPADGYAWLDVGGYGTVNSLAGVWLDVNWTTDEAAERAAGDVERWLHDHAAEYGIAKWSTILTPREG